MKNKHLQQTNKQITKANNFHKGRKGSTMTIMLKHHMVYLSSQGRATLTTLMMRSTVSRNHFALASSPSHEADSSSINHHVDSFLPSFKVLGRPSISRRWCHKVRVQTRSMFLVLVPFRTFMLIEGLMSMTDWAIVAYHETNVFWSKL